MRATTIAVLLPPLVSGLANRKTTLDSDLYRFHLDFDESTSTLVEDEDRHSRPTSELFELSIASHTLHDAQGGTCFLDDETYEFLCSDAVDLPQTTWAFIDSSGGRRFLSADGEDAWIVCDALEEEEDDSPRVFSGIQEGHDGCFKGRLWLSDYTAPSHILGGNSLDLRVIEGDSPPSEDRPLLRARQTPSCTASSAFPSLAPTNLYVGPANQSVYNTDPQNVAAITTNNSTLWGFTIGSDYPAADGVARTCGLQFRFPYCSDLPAGYPCYAYSGMEQEITANSGVYWRQVQINGTMNNYQEIGFSQPFPGDNTTVATFDCGGGASAIQQVMWLAESWYGFQLQFLQAGMSAPIPKRAEVVNIKEGHPTQYTDGMGLFIVACE